MRVNVLVWIWITAAVLLFTACEEDDPTLTNDREATLSLKVHHMFNGDSLVYNQIYTLDSTGRRLAIQHVSFYLSNIKLSKTDGSVAVFPDKVLLVEPGRELYPVGAVDNDSYNQLFLSFGLDSATNHSRPADYAAGHPLANQVPDMHWGDIPGYIFMRIEGEVDTSMTPDGTLDVPMVYQIGLDANYKQLIIDRDFEVLNGLSPTIHLQIDYKELLEDLNMTAQYKANPLQGGLESVTAQQIANKIPASLQLKAGD